MDLSADKHIENLEEYEQGEDEGHMATWTILLFKSFVQRVNTVCVVWSTRVHGARSVPFDYSIELVLAVTTLGDNILSVEHKEEDNESLANTHTKDVLDHLTRYNIVITRLRFSLKEGIRWFLSSKS